MFGSDSKEGRSLLFGSKIQNKRSCVMYLLFEFCLIFRFLVLNFRPPWSNKGHIPRYGREKMQYVGRQLMAELGLSQWRSREFWAMLLLIAFTWWIRLYTHYGGQWIFLQALQVPVSK